MNLIYLNFIVIVSVVVYTSIRLSDLTEWFELNTKLKSVLIGIILAFATSLPELVTSLTSVYIGEPELAISGILGSNMFNFVILSIGFLIVFKYFPLSKVEGNTNKINMFLVLIYSFTIFIYFYSVVDNNPSTIFKASIISIFIFTIYFYSIYSLNKGTTDSISVTSATKNEIIKKSTTAIVLMAIVIISSAFLAKSVETIMTYTGMNASLAGALLIGASTSLPEAVATISILKKRLFDIAVASVIGSNIFNFAILGITDLVYKGNILKFVSSNTLLLLYLGLTSSLIYFLTLKYNKGKSKLLQLVTPITIITLYFLYITM